MKKLNTIQKRERLNDVYSVDKEGPGGAHHRYVICKYGKTEWQNGNTREGILLDIKFQCGPRKEEDSQHGVGNEDLLEIVRDRLKSFQAGAFPSEYNKKALEHVEEALMWLNRRVEDRIERNVLGTYEK